MTVPNQLQPITQDGALIDRVWYRFLATSLGTIPAGTISQFAGTAAPSGWLLCNGAAVSRTTYAALFAAIGTTWGVGNGSSTFNVPNLTAPNPLIMIVKT